MADLNLLGSLAGTLNKPGNGGGGSSFDPANYYNAPDLSGIPQANTASADDLAKASPVNLGIFGQTIPVLFGGTQLLCAPVWAADVITNSDGSRKVTFAAMAGKRAPNVDSVELRRIWMDGILAYDNTGVVDSKQALTFRFYDGDEAQLPDPAIIEKEGAAHAPAFRDRMYIVIADWTVQLGASFPQVAVEVVQHTNPNNIRYVAPWKYNNTDNYGSTSWYLSFGADFGYYTNGTTGHIDVYSISGQSFSNSFALPSGYDGMISVAKTEPYVYLIGAGKVGVCTSTGVLLGEYADERIAFMAHTCVGHSINGYDEVILLEMLFQNYMLIGRKGGALSFLAFDTFDGGGIAGPASAMFADVRQISPNSDYSLAYVANSYRTFVGVLLYTTTVDVRLADTSTVEANAGTWQLDTSPWAPIIVMVDPEEAAWVSFIFTGESTPNQQYRKYKTCFGRIKDGHYDAPPEYLEEIARADLPFTLLTAQQGANQLNSIREGQTHIVGTDGGLGCYVVDMFDGSYVHYPQGSFVVIDNPEITDITGDLARFFVYDANKKAMYYHTLGGTKYYPGVLYLYDTSAAGGTMLLSDFTRALATLAKYPADQIVTDGIDDALTGAIINQPTTIMDIAQAAASLFRFDFYEVGGKITFKRKNRAGGFAVDRTLTEDDLMFVNSSNDDAGLFSKTRLNTSKLPVVITTTYLDANNDFQLGTQSARRTQYPVRAANGTLTAQLGVPIAMDAKTALYFTELCLFDTWAQAMQLAFRLPVGQIDLEPGDYVQLNTLNYGSYTVKLSELYYNPDYSIDVTAVCVLATAPGNTSINPIDVASTDKPTLPGFGGTNYTLYIVDNLPLVSAEDRSPDTVATVSLFATVPLTVRVTSDPYPSSTVDVTAVPPRGILAALPPPKGLSNTPRDDIEFRVHMVGDAVPVAATNDDFLAGKSAVLIGATGRWELCYFRDVTLNSDGTYSLTHLLRSQRGSDASAEVQSGDTVLFISGVYPTPVAYPASTAAVDFTFKSVLNGANIDTATFKKSTVTLTCGSIRPWSVSHVRAAEASGDVVLTWDRRDRADSDITDLTDYTPLAEASERYDVEIIALDGTVKRTYSALTGPTCTYTAAHIAADGLDVSTSVHVKVYQLSAAVGRGYVRNVVCPVT